jgi:hypothetical protein
VQIDAQLQRQSNACHGLNVHKIVGGARVEECREPLVVDVDVDLHCAPESWLDAHEHVNGDHRVYNGLCQHRLILVRRSTILARDNLVAIALSSTNGDDDVALLMTRGVSRLVWY